MCGIVGAVDLTGRRLFPSDRLLQMTAAIAHRGPDDEHIHIEPGVALGNRRLAIIDVAGGRQPLSNETRDVWVAFEGELYEYPELRPQLLKRGHRLSTHCDTEAWVHLYEDLGEEVFLKAEGQFSVSLWDQRARKLMLARDRVGIGPLFYAQQDGWLLWSSEIKGLLASGMIEAEPDPRGIDYAFNFFSLPNERTCFANVRQIPPGHYMVVRDGKFTIRRYWDLDFPDAGAERRFANDSQGVDELEALLRGAVKRRLASEVPVSSYLSGGLDSTVILALACQERGQPVPSFTVGLDKSGPYDERHKAAQSARFFGSKHTIANVTSNDIAESYPKLVAAAEGPVLDTSSASLVMLAAANRRAGNIVALTGEGADEALAGYVWYKYHRCSVFGNKFGNPIQRFIRQLLLKRLIGGPSTHRPPFFAADGARFAQQISWEMLAQSREQYYSPDMWDRLGDYSAYNDLPPLPERMPKWHYLNQSLYMGYKVLLAGLLLAGKGDRVLRTASTEGRYPFLDEKVVHFCSRLAPEYKLRGQTDKWLLREVANRVAPQQIRERRKVMFRANMGSAFLGNNRPEWVDQLLSPESLSATGYFNSTAIERVRRQQLAQGGNGARRFSYDMGLAGVISTQLWHHLYFGGGLCCLPTWSINSYASSLSHISSVA
jgi:asparagine synthase (glutamine-hydrolysing)